MEIKELKKRKEVKKTESPIEDALLKWFHEYGLFPETQHPIGNYRADLFLKEKNLVIECDGKEFHSSDEQIKYDQERDAYMREQGYKVERFTGGRIHHEPFTIVKEILNNYYYKESMERKPILETIIPDSSDLDKMRKKMVDDMRKEIYSGDKFWGK